MNEKLSLIEKLPMTLGDPMIEDAKDPQSIEISLQIAFSDGQILYPVVVLGGVSFEGQQQIAERMVAVWNAFAGVATKDVPLKFFKTPTINAPWPEQGGIYIGSRFIDGNLNHLVIPGGIEHDIEKVNFDDVPASIPKEINGHEDWRAPDQEDLTLAWINARERFMQEGSDSIYWSRSESSEHWAWGVDFENGFTNYGNRRYEFRVKPFRSIPDSVL